MSVMKSEKLALYHKTGFKIVHDNQCAIAMNLIHE